jgi:hypothetical protein
MTGRHAGPLVMLAALAVTASASALKLNPPLSASPEDPTS